MAVDGSGDVFIAVPLSYEVIEVKPGSAPSTVPASGLDLPWGVAADAQGDVFIADKLNNRVVEAAAGVPATVTPAPTSVQLSASAATLVSGQPETLTAAVTASGSTPTGGTVTFLDGGKAIGTAALVNGKAALTTSLLPPGTHLFTASYGGTVSYNPAASGVEQTTAVLTVLKVSNPGGLATDAQGDLFVVELSQGRVVKIGPAAAETTVGSGLSNPQGVAVDGSGDVFIADSGNRRVVEVTPGAAQTTVASGLNGVDAVAVDGGGDMYVVDLSPPLNGDLLPGNQVVKITPDGTQTTIRGGFFGTDGVAVDGRGDLFISDTDIGVEEIQPNGSYTDLNLGPPARVGTGQGVHYEFGYPTGVAVDAQGDVFVPMQYYYYDDFANVLELKVDGTVTSIPWQFFQPGAVAVDGRGDLFMSEDFEKAVLETQAGVPVTVTPGTPTAQAQSLRVALNAQAAITLTGSDPDGPPLPLTYKVASGPSHGTLTGTAPNLIYTPNPGYLGPDSFSFTASNVFNTSAAGTVSIAVNIPTSIDLAASAATLAGGLSETLTATVTASGSTPAGGTVTFLDGGKAIGTASLVNGKAALTTSTLTLGTNVLTASYGGAGNYAPSASGVEPTSTSSAVGSGLSEPQGIAVDGSGDVFIVNSGNDRIVEVKPGGADDRRLGAERPLKRRGGRPGRPVRRPAGFVGRSRRDQARRRRRPSPRG